jgi:glycosyltransferase involved in cell wall biosynthesis
MVKLAGGLTDRGMTVDLVATRAEGPLLSLVPSSVRLVNLRSNRVFRSLPALVRYIRSERPRALITALNYVNVVALWARRLSRVPTRVIISEQNTPTALAPHSHKRRARLMPALTRRFYRWADRITAVSEGVRDDLVDSLGIERDRIDVIYNPVVSSDLRDRSEEPLDHPWFRSGQPPVVVSVGRLSAQKDYPLLFQALAKLRTSMDARLIILGEGPLRRQLEARVTELGLQDHVALPGFVDNPYAYLSRASLFVLSSHCEGLPTVVIEALFCGARVVSTDCPSGPHEILQGGKYGRLVDVGDAEGLARAMEASLREPPAPPPRESWTPYTVEAVAEMYGRLVSELG